DRQAGTPADKQARALARDPYLWAHPERIARDLAHRERPTGSGANDTDRARPCHCPPLHAFLADLSDSTTPPPHTPLPPPAAAQRAPPPVPQPPSRPVIAEPTTDNDPAHGADDPDAGDPLTAADILGHAQDAEPRPPEAKGPNDSQASRLVALALGRYRLVK